jgi:hypothetical protein
VHGLRIFREGTFPARTPEKFSRKILTEVASSTDARHGRRRITAPAEALGAKHSGQPVPPSPAARETGERWKIFA